MIVVLVEGHVSCAATNTQRRCKPTVRILLYLALQTRHFVLQRVEIAGERLWSAKTMMIAACGPMLPTCKKFLFQAFDPKRSIPHPRPHNGCMKAVGGRTINSTTQHLGRCLQETTAVLTRIRFLRHLEQICGEVICGCPGPSRTCRACLRIPACRQKVLEHRPPQVRE